MPTWLPFAFIALACPIGMGLMMWFMMRMMRMPHEPQDAMRPEDRLALLEAERHALERQIAAAKDEVGVGAASGSQDQKASPSWKRV